MILFRSLVYFVALVVSIFVFALPLIVFGWVMPFRSRSRVASAWGWTNIKLQAWICDLRYRIRGQENIPRKSVIYMSKHQSAWETIALRGLLTPEQTWVVKRELTWIPFFGWALAACEPIAIDRKLGRKAARQVIEQGVKRLQEGRSVIIFPEGTRVAPGQRKRYSIGGASLAEHSAYPIIPIAHNAGVFWSRRGLKKYPGVIDVVIGPRIETQGLKAAEIIQRVESWIETTMEKLPQTPDVQTPQERQTEETG